MYFKLCLKHFQGVSGCPPPVQLHKQSIASSTLLYTPMSDTCLIYDVCTCMYYHCTYFDTVHCTLNVLHLSPMPTTFKSKGSSTTYYEYSDSIT